MNVIAALMVKRHASAQVESMIQIPLAMILMEKNAVKTSGALLMDMDNALRIMTLAAN